MLVKSDGATLNIGSYDFEQENEVTEEIHGWGIIRPLLSRRAPGPDLYRALYFILHWAKWAFKNEHTISHPPHLVQQRVDVLEWLFPWMEEIPGLKPHAETIKQLLAAEFNQIRAT